MRSITSRPLAASFRKPEAVIDPSGNASAAATARRSGASRCTWSRGKIRGWLIVTPPLGLTLARIYAAQASGDYQAVFGGVGSGNHSVRQLMRSNRLPLLTGTSSCAWLASSFAPHVIYSSKFSRKLPECRPGITSPLVARKPRRTCPRNLAPG
jgi:hypothetical protein